MAKTDLQKDFKSYYTAKTKPELTEVAPARFLSLTGQGDPSAVEFTDRIQALYTASYAIKFQYKKLEKDFIVSKLEGLWWFDSEKYKDIFASDIPVSIPRNEWQFRLLIRLPDFVEAARVESIIQDLLTKKPLKLLAEISLFEMNEGKSVQMMHIGPFHTEPESLKQIDQFMKENKLEKAGFHHEIYLSDFRKTAPEKLKTILREPVKHK